MSRRLRATASAAIGVFDFDSRNTFGAPRVHDQDRGVDCRGGLAQPHLHGLRGGNLVVPRGDPGAQRLRHQVQRPARQREHAPAAARTAPDSRAAPATRGSPGRILRPGVVPVQQIASRMVRWSGIKISFNNSEQLPVPRRPRTCQSSMISTSGIGTSNNVSGPVPAASSVRRR